MDRSFIHHIGEITRFHGYIHDYSYVDEQAMASIENCERHYRRVTESKYIKYGLDGFSHPPEDAVPKISTIPNVITGGCIEFCFLFLDVLRSLPFAMLSCCSFVSTVLHTLPLMLEEQLVDAITGLQVTRGVIITSSPWRIDKWIQPGAREKSRKCFWITMVYYNLGSC